MRDLDVSARIIIGNDIKLVLNEDIITSLVGIEHLNINMSLSSAINGIKDIEDRSNARSTSNQTNFGSSLLTSTLVLKDSITLVFAHTNRSLTGHGIADVQCTEIVTHFTSVWEFFSSGVALDYKVDVTFGVDGRDGGIRAANHSFAFCSWLAEKLDMVSHGHAYDPLGVRELKTDADGVMRHVLDLLNSQLELVVFVLLRVLTDSLSTLRSVKEC